MRAVRVGKKRQMKQDTSVAFERGLPRVILALLCVTAILLAGLSLISCGGSPPRAPTDAEREAYCLNLSALRQNVERYSADELELEARSLALDEMARLGRCE